MIAQRWETFEQAALRLEELEIVLKGLRAQLEREVVRGTLAELEDAADLIRSLVFDAQGAST